MYRRNHSIPRRRGHGLYLCEQLVSPLPDIRGHRPVIVAIDRSTMEATLAYRDAPLDGPLAVAVTDDRAADGQPFHMPENTPVLSLRSGTVVSASVADGVTVDHRNGFCTTYRGLSETLVDAGQQIYGGDVIGMIRLPSSSPCALRFELWRNQPWREELVRQIGFCRGINPLNALLGTISFPIEGLRRPVRKEAA